MAENDRRRLEELEARLRAAWERQEGARAGDDDMLTRGQLGWRMVTELVSGLLIGFGMGYGLDVLLGTMPVFLVIFVLAGLAAGIRVMLRTAREFETIGRHAPARADEGTDEDGSGS